MTPKQQMLRKKKVLRHITHSVSDSSIGSLVDSSFVPSTSACSEEIMGFDISSTRLLNRIIEIELVAGSNTTLKVWTPQVYAVHPRMHGARFPSGYLSSKASAVVYDSEMIGTVRPCSILICRIGLCSNSGTEST